MTPTLPGCAAELSRRLLVSAAPPRERSEGALATAQVWHVPVEAERGLAAATGSPTGHGLAFGVAWPYWCDDQRLVTPGVPLAVTSEEAVAPGGAYRRDGSRVLREAVGRDTVVLGAADGSATEPPFSLLWFAAEERCTVAGGQLTIESLFGSVTLVADPPAVARLLAPAWRDEVGDELARLAAPSPQGAPATIEVARSGELIPAAVWSDPVALLTARSDVAAVRTRADGITLQRLDGTTASFRVTARDDGWRLERTRGDDLFARLSALRDDARLVLRATPDARLDLLQARIRSRLTFDLGALLVALGRGAGQNV